MSTCPFCGGEYSGEHPAPNLSRRQREVYDAVVASGPSGISTEALISVVYGDTPPKSGWGVIRVNVFEINRKIKDIGQRIRGRRNIGYILLSNNNQVNGE